jgi:hypothetical protein
MRSASIAEWMLTRFMSRGQASSTIGDLLEALPHKGVAWFWASVGGIILSLTWRRSLAFVAAFCFGFYALGALQLPIYSIHTAHRPPHNLMPFFILLGDAGILLSFGVAYLTVRFGLKDSFVRHILAVWVLVVAFIFCWWIPVIANVCGIIAICAFIYMVMSVPGRRKLVALALALGLSFVGASLALYVMDTLQNVARLSPLISTAALFAVLIQTSIYSKVHCMFFESKSRDESQRATA